MMMKYGLGLLNLIKFEWFLDRFYDVEVDYLIIFNE